MESNFQSRSQQASSRYYIQQKIQKATHPPLLFNNNTASQVNSQKRLGVILDIKLTFEEHLKIVFNKTNKTIGHSWKLSNLLPRQALVTIYKAFVRPAVDYGDVLYIQYTACLAITGAIQGKIYQELGLESLQLCRC